MTQIHKLRIEIEALKFTLINDPKNAAQSNEYYLNELISEKEMELNDLQFENENSLPF